MKAIFLTVPRTSVLLPLLCISALPAYSQDTSKSTLQDTLTLEEAVVIARRTRHQADGYTVNLRSSDIVRGKTSSDALVFLPGVSRQGSVYRISGIDVSEIYVDGMKLTSFDELDNIPADRIDKVKVNYLAGLNQNASITGGTIEITLKRIPEGGYSGSVFRKAATPAASLPWEAMPITEVWAMPGCSSRPATARPASTTASLSTAEQ